MLGGIGICGRGGRRRCCRGGLLAALDAAAALAAAFSFARDSTCFRLAESSALSKIRVATASRPSSVSFQPDSVSGVQAGFSAAPNANSTSPRSSGLHDVEATPANSRKSSPHASRWSSVERAEAQLDGAGRFAQKRLAKSRRGGRGHRESEFPRHGALGRKSQMEGIAFGGALGLNLLGGQDCQRAFRSRGLSQNLGDVFAPTRAEIPRRWAGVRLDRRRS